MVLKWPNAWDNSPQDARSWPNNIPLGARAQTRASSCSELTCYGCRDKGHTMNNCLKVNELINKGIIKRDNNRKLIIRDGTLIIHTRNESIIFAVQKLTIAMRKPQSNYGAYSLNTNFYSSDSDSNNEIFILPAEQTLKVSKDVRKARFKEVFSPPLPDWTCKLKDIPRKLTPISQPPRAPVPIEVHAPTFDPNNDDAI
ncbi:hypothetical protein BKA93DRAFT_728990 [Sparassis latifolia]